VENRSDFYPLLALWVGILAVLTWWGWRRKEFQTVGLVHAYAFQFWLNYWIGAAVHALPWSELPEADLVYSGFVESTKGLVCFALGAVLLGPVIGRRWCAGRQGVFRPHPQLPSAYVSAGIITFLVLKPTIGTLPSIMALTAVGQQLVVVGCCLAAWKAWLEGGTQKLIRSLIPLLALPVVTVVSMGFLGYGVIAVSIVLIFASQFMRSRTWLVVGLVVGGYVGLSFFTVYMKQRTMLRERVWGGESMSRRVEGLVNVVTSFEWFDLRRQDHLAAVDDRLNQGNLVGAAVVHLAITGDFVKGETIVDAALGMIPRVIWPSKPPTGGSGAWASRFTGRTFAEGTSVGVGQVMELYGNFGSTGVMCGFLVLGTLLSAFDIAAGARLTRGDWMGFSLWFLIGMALLNAGGSLVEMTSSGIASYIVARLTNTLLERYQRRHSLRFHAPARVPSIHRRSIG
jgi:hypothetical protein